jgi:cell division protein FtsI (penicillin-binding protein 3)
MVRRRKVNNARPIGRKVRDPFQWRSKFVSVVFVLLMLVLLGRAFQLQILQHDWYANLARQIQSKEERLTHRRGPILDRHNEALAFSLDADSVYAEPHRIQDLDETTSTLARILELDPKWVRETLQKDRYFVWLKRRISADQSAMFDATPMPGIGRLRESDRRYPFAELASQVIGFSGMDAVGLEGLEFFYDEPLKGDAGYLVGERDAHGTMFFPNGVRYVNSSLGGSLRLTIDAKIQYFTEQALEDGWKKANAKRAMAIVMNPYTGEILAVAQRPGFNPNSASDYPQEDRINHVVVDVFEPGSVMKPYIISPAIETGRVNLTETINCEMGSLAIGNHVIHDSHSHGAMTIPQIIQKSSNIGTAKVAMRMGADEVYKWLSRFGFGDKSGIDFPGESSGILRPASTWSKVGLANVAFGQGVAVSPVQLLAAFSSLVNGGILMRPYLVAEVRNAQGQIVKKTNPTIVRRVLEEKTSETITDILTLVTMPGGTGTAAALRDYAVAGKTGTAQKAEPNSHGYSATARIGSFVGAVPAKNPRIAIYVVMDEPKGSQAIKYGGVCAAPVFKMIAERTMQYLDGGKVKERKIPERAIPKIALEDAVEGGVIEERAGEETQAPNLVGLPIKEVIQLAGRRNLKLTLVGSGVAVRQIPLPGTQLDEDRSVKVEFDPDGREG